MPPEATCLTPHEGIQTRDSPRVTLKRSDELSRSHPTTRYLWRRSRLGSVFSGRDARLEFSSSTRRRQSLCPSKLFHLSPSKMTALLA